MSTWFDVAVESAPTGGALGSIDFPRPDTKLYGDRLEVWGWAMTKDAPAAAVLAGARGRTAVRVAPGRSRPDVAASFADVPHAGRSGFSLVASVPPAGRVEVLVSIVLPDGDRLEVGVIRLVSRTSDSGSGDDAPLVSVVIPCYNQAQFLPEAVESARRQTYPNVEVIVVDDGSTDDTAAVAGDMGVRCVRQENRGLPGARNTGIRASNGEFVVFLDADDRLLPHGLEANADEFAVRPDAAFVAGWCCRVNQRGDPVPLAVEPPEPPEQEPYAALLDCSYWISCPAQVMFRRAALLEVGGFEESLAAAEDWDLYLRLARSGPLYAHERGPVCEYREHAAAMSRDSERMLRWSSVALRRQRHWTRRNAALRGAYRRGVASVHRLYGEPLARDAALALGGRSWEGALSALSTLLRFYPRGLLSSLRYSRHTPG